MSISEYSADLPARQNPAEASHERYTWNFVQRIAFRFACCFLLIDNFPHPLDSLTRIFDWYDNLSSKFMYMLVPWVGKQIFHATILTNVAFFEEGIGYERFAYVQLFCDVVFAILATIVWSLLDRKRKEYIRLHDWLRVYMRYALGANIVGYGLAKVLEAQMAFPNLDQLLQPFGNSSPMGLLWKFIGYSTTYEFFCGAAELLGGILVFFRRTTTLGALLLIAVMINVTLMNFCYDVPVKIHALRLVFLSVFLLLPDLRSLLNFLVLKRTTTPAKIGQTFTTKWMKTAGWTIKVLFIGYILFADTNNSIKGERRRASYERLLDGKTTLQSPFFGIYEVEEFSKNGKVVPPLTTDSNRWDKLIFYGSSSMKIRTMTDSDIYSGQIYTEQVDAAKNTMTLSPAIKEAVKDTSATAGNDQDDKYIFTYAKPDASHLILQGTLKNDSFVVKTRRIDTDMPLLTRRGFHWVTDDPLNR